VLVYPRIRLHLNNFHLYLSIYHQFPSPTSSIESTLQAGAKGFPDDFQRYLRWNKLYTEIRGMESYCARNLIERINQHKLTIRKNLFDLQAKLRSFNLVPEIRNKILKDAYARDVQPDRILARVQGIVDAASLKRMREEASSAGLFLSDTCESVTIAPSYKLEFARKKAKLVHPNILVDTKKNDKKHELR
jgi:hypothetical protein